MISNLLNQIPQMILLLPAILISLSIHESAHGYAAYKLGDPTARNLGRITLNPVKHFDLMGFLAMLFFKIGWANPVPINARNFKNPRRDMAISAAAGPISNFCLAAIFTVLLRLDMLAIDAISGNLISFPMAGYYYIDELLRSNAVFTVLSILAVMLYFGISLNLNLMIFNLIPLPPLDGSRIAYVFLPTKTYFKIMQYEKYIMIAFILLIATGIVSLPLGFITGGISDLLYAVTGMPENLLLAVVSDILNRLPTFSL